MASQDVINLAKSHLGKWAVEPEAAYVKDHYRAQVSKEDGNIVILGKSTRMAAAEKFEQAVRACMLPGADGSDERVVVTTHIFSFTDGNVQEVTADPRPSEGHIFVQRIQVPGDRFPSAGVDTNGIACVVDIVDGFRYLGCGYSSLEWDAAARGDGAGAAAGSGPEAVAEAYDDEAGSDSDLYAITEAPTVVSRYVFAEADAPAAGTSSVVSRYVFRT